MLRRLLALAVLLASTFAQAEDPAAKPEFDPAHAEKMKEGLEVFKAQVRDVLVDRCVDCHGGPEVQSGFDLATRKGLLRGGAHGAAIVAGKSADSNLLRLVRRQQKPFMPHNDDPLTAAEIASLARWIDLGAPYDTPLVDKPRDPDSWTATVVDAQARNFWSLLPLAHPAPPAVKNEAWVRDPLDRFILAKLEEQGLTPNAMADRRTLLRRVCFDLSGLPPTPAETEQFLNDADPRAYEKLIDRLLASPHFGERWARHWLDAARFAESHGFEQDYDRPHAYHFRDFVIEAFNTDMPYDQFVRWQLAGDEYAPDNILALKATGFLGAGVFPTQITANEVERTRYDALDDMAATTGSALLGLSVGCARCHDHKFDPIPQADYYRFVATFTTTVRSDLDVNPDPQGFARAKAAHQAEHAPFVAAREKFERDELPARFAEWDKANGPHMPSVWQTLAITNARSKGGATMIVQSDGSVLASQANPDFDTYIIGADLPPGEYTGVRIEALADPSLVKGGPGRAENGNFALTNLQAEFKLADDKKQPLKLTNPQATFEQSPQGLFVKNTIDGDPKSGWAVDPQFGTDHAAVYELAEPLKVTEAGTLVVTLDFQNNKQHQIGRVRVSVTSRTEKPLPVEVGGMSLAGARALTTPADQRTPEQAKAALNYYRTLDPQWQTLHKAEVEHAQSEPQPNLVKVMVCSEGVTPIRHHTQGADFFNETYFLKRGDTNQKMGVASPGFLQVLTTGAGADAERRWRTEPPQGAKTSYRRRALAEWMTDTEAGAGRLLARVIVNRLWNHHFGRGIVGTPNDFGVQGERPTHPELLDYLARQFIADGWKLKALHRRILLSAAYTQSSAFDTADAKIDPENRWLWRRTPQRVEAEVIRDSLLAVSGQLDRTLYGPGTLDEGHKRRSLYFMVKRSKLVPMMQLFDQPEPLVSIGNRPSTTIAPQALALLNSPHVRGCARSFAENLATMWTESPEKAVRHGYLTALSRPPDAEELTATVAFLQAQEASYNTDGKPDPRTLALVDFCQVLFGLNEFVYVE